MNRWLRFGLCLATGLLLVAGGWLVPAHLRALDTGVAELAGKKSRTVVQEGFALLEQKQLGPAHALMLAARAQNLPECDRLGLAR